MKTHLSIAAVAITLLACAATASAQLPGLNAPTLPEVLKLAGGKATIFTPVSISRSHVVRFTLTALGDGSVRPGAPTRSFHLLVFRAVKDGTSNTLLAQQQFTPSPANGPIHTFDLLGTQIDPDAFDSTGRSQIIAALIGLLTPADPNLPPVIGGLSKDAAFSAEVFDSGGSGIGLLLPAVQKVREAAAR